MRNWPWTAILLLACLSMSAYTSHQLRKLAEAQAGLAQSLVDVSEALADKAEAEIATGRCL